MSMQTRLYSKHYEYLHSFKVVSDKIYHYNGTERLIDKWVNSLIIAILLKTKQRKSFARLKKNMCILNDMHRYVC